MKARIMMTGACRPTLITTNPMVAARLYAGATDANAITVLERSPSAPGLRPFSKMSKPAAEASPLPVVAITTPPLDLSARLPASTEGSRPDSQSTGAAHGNWRGDGEHPKDLLGHHPPPSGRNVRICLG